MSLCKIAARSIVRRENKPISSGQLQKQIWGGKFRAAGFVLDKTASMSSDLFWATMKSLVVRTVEQYKVWRGNAADMSADLTRLMKVECFPRSVVHLHLAELREIIGQGDLKRQYCEFNSLFKRLEEERSGEMSVSGMRWSELVPRAAAFPVCSTKYRTDLLSMQEVFDTYSQPARTRPLTALPNRQRIH